MAKFKKGDKIIDWCGRKGSITDIHRFDVNLPKGKKHTTIKYLVKWDKPTLFNTWAAMDGDKIQKIPQTPPEPKHIYHTISFTANSGNKVTLAAYTISQRYITVGFCICHEKDEFDSSVGISLAKYRAKKHPYKLYYKKKGMENHISSILDECRKELEENWKTPIKNIITLDNIGDIEL